jgi:hypothetical protein
VDLGFGSLMVQRAAPGHPGEHLVGLGHMLVVLVGERDTDVGDGDPGLAGGSMAGFWGDIGFLLAWRGGVALLRLWSPWAGGGRGAS